MIRSPSYNLIVFSAAGQEELGIIPIPHHLIISTYSETKLYNNTGSS